MTMPRIERVKMPATRDELRGYTLHMWRAFAVTIARRSLPQKRTIATGERFCVIRTRRWSILVGWDVPMPIGTEIAQPPKACLGTSRVWHNWRRLEGTTNCPKCGREVELWSETDQWTSHPTKIHHYEHARYGTGYGVCCLHVFTHDKWGGQPMLTSLI